MNWEIFSPIGYTSVVLLACIPLLWLLHGLIKPRKWLAHVALICAILALPLAIMNSQSYVARITVDQAEVVEQAMAARDLARQQAEAQRAAEAANIRFAEDEPDAQLDKAGLDDTDLAYFESFDKDSPEWKQQKQARDLDAGMDDDLEAMIGGTTEREGIEVEGMQEQAEQREPIFMSEKDVLAANRMDKANLTTTKVMLALALLFVVFDYVRRLNSYREAYFPLPIPSKWADALTARPSVAVQADKPRRSLQDELRFITRRGEVFLYCSDDPSVVKQASTTLPRLPGGQWPIRVLDLKELPELDDRFVFETLWFGRHSFVLKDQERAQQLLESIVGWLANRRESKAHTKQRVHLVWDLPVEVPDAMRQRIEILGKATGLTLLICRPTEPKEAAA
ncbi:MAG: hypothetical protein AB8C95_14525 [Phycisphaeraceae bacterium]